VDLAARFRRGSARCAPSAWQLITSLIAGVCLTIAGAARAAEEYEPRVARVSFVEGEASYLNADADEWTAVEVNAPLVTGDRFYSGADGRAEIQLPGGIDARLASETELEMLDVSDRAVQVRVGIGTATFRVRTVPANVHVEFSTPSTALVARSRGVYRVDVAQDGQTTVLVREGEVDAYLGDDRYRLEQGRGARILDASYVQDAPADTRPFEVFDATEVPYDPWDDWERERAGRIQNASSYQYVDDEVYGVADLDEYGSWDRHAEYGPIWRPTRVSAGWAPFTQGRWVWQDPWGWTWVDYEPWGWAPSHHGRWVYVQDAWAWAPGPVVARPVYAPATVGFLGVSVNTPSVSVSVGIGPSVGWVPLGWGEPIVPWWGGFGGVRRGSPYWGGWGGPRIVNNKVIKNTNITNINVTNINYTNIDRPRGFTAVSRESFVRGDLQRLDLPQERVREFARPVGGAPDVIPQRESLFAARPEKLRGGRAAKPSQEVLQRAALSTRAVPASRPGFDQKLERIQRDKGAPVAPREMRQMEGSRQATEQTARVRTVASRGKKAVVPEVNARASEVARDGRGRTTRDERQAAVPAERGAPEGRAMPSVRTDARDAARPEANEQLRENDRAKAERGPQVRGPEGRADAGERTAPGRPQQDAELQQNAQKGDRRLPQGAGARDEQAGRQPAERNARTQAEREQTQQAERAQREQTERTQRETAAREQRDTQDRQRAQAERQHDQAERTQRETAQRENRASQERQRAQVERQQRDETERTQRATAQREQRATQERANQERQRAQAAEQQQRQQAQRAQAAEQQQRQQAERAQRDAAEREQRAQQQKRERVPDRQSMQRQAPQRPAPERDERQANRKERRQQERARMAPGA